MIPKLRFPKYATEGYEQKLLNDLCFRIGDGIHSTPRYDDNGEYFFVNGNNLINGDLVVSEKTKKVNKEEYRKHQKNLNTHTLLMSINGTIGNLAFYRGEKIVLGKSACFISPKSESLSHFLYSYLKSPTTIRYFRSQLTGSTIQNLSLAAIRNLIVNKPKSENEIQCNNEFFQHIDSKIHLLTKKKEALETYKKGLMQKIFSQELRFKREDGTDYPEWERLQLDKVASVIDPHPSHRAPKVDPNGIPFIGIGDINERGELINDKVRLVSEDIYWEQRESFKISKGDFAFCRVASVGKVIDLTDTANRIYSFSPTMAIIKPLNINAEFLRIYLSSNHFQKIAMSLVSGSTRVSLGMQNLRRLHIILPSEDEQKKISNSLSVLNHKIQLTKDSISSAQNLKKGLLQQMFV